MQKFIVFALLVLLIFPSAVFARIGVGISTGEIQIKEPLKSGGIYELSSLQVRNTGDEAGYYTLGIAYSGDRPQIKTPQEWFSWSPEKFYLEPGEWKLVPIKLTVPLKAEPGDYFNYVQARPVQEAGSGTSVGIAVAAKLFFTVLPSNFWQAVTWRLSTFWANNSPWTWVVLGVVLAAIIITLFKRFFSFQLGVKKGKKK